MHSFSVQLEIQLTTLYFMSLWFRLSSILKNTCHSSFSFDLAVVTNFYQNCILRFFLFCHASCALQWKIRLTDFILIWLFTSCDTGEQVWYRECKSKATKNTVVESVAYIPNKKFKHFKQAISWHITLHKAKKTIVYILKCVRVQSQNRHFLQLTIVPCSWVHIWGISM